MFILHSFARGGSSDALNMLWTSSGFGGNKNTELGGDMCLYYTVLPGEAHQTH